MAVLAPFFVPQFFDNSGNPLASGKLYTYVTGTTTNKAAYQDQAGTTPHSNPITLDSSGRVQPGLWLATDAEYRLRLETSASVLVDEWDDIGGQVSTIDLAASGGAASIGFIQDGTGAVATTLQTYGRRKKAMPDYGATVDGTTDDSAAFVLGVGKGREIELTTGTQLIKTNNATAATTVANTRLVGQGETTILKVEEQSATGTSEVVTLGGAGTWLERLKVTFSKVLSGVSTAILFKTRYNKLIIRGVTIDGGTALVSGTQDRSVQIVKSHATAATNTVILDNLDVTDVARVYTRDNADTDATKIIKVLGGVFRNIWRTCFTFNAPSGSIEDVLVIGSSFDTHAGIANSDSSLADNNNAVGLIGVRGGRVIGTHVSGAYGAVVHIEENTDGAVIIGNTARMANESATDAAMETTGNNISGVATSPTHLVHMGNVLRSTDGVGTGFWVQSGASVDGAKWSAYVGNVSSGFDDAFKSSTDLRSVLVANNILRGTTNGVDLTRASLLVRDNVIEDCTVPVVCARGGLLGAVHYVDLSGATAALTAFGSATTGPLSLTEWTWESDLFTGINGTNYTDIGPVPTRVYGMVTITAISGTEHRISTIEVTYDGATWTNTVKQSYGAGDITITGFATNVGQIAVQFADATGPSANIRLQVRFYGGHFVI